MFTRRLRPIMASVFKTEAGHKFQAELGSPNGYPRPRKEIQNLPHRAMTTTRASIAVAGDMVSTAGHRYLLCGQHVLDNAKRFLAVEINKEVCWERAQEVIDPVTRMPRDSAVNVIDAALPVVIEPTRTLEEEQFQVNQYRFLTHAPIELGDFIDGRKVMTTADLMGLLLVEVA